MDSLHTLTLFDIFEKNSRQYGTQPAVSWQGTDHSFNQLFQDTARLASGLYGLKLAPKERIAVIAANHPAFLHLFGAAAALNLTLVLVNRRLSKEEIAYIIEDTTPAVIVADAEQAGFALALKEKFASLKSHFIIDGSDTGSDFNSLYGSDMLTRPVPADARDPFMIIHTAAVQGKPRGAVLGHENVIMANDQIAAVLKLDPDATYLNILPLFHIMGINLCLAVLQAGGKNVILKAFDARESLDLIQDQRVTMIGSFPPILSTLIEEAENGTYDLSSLTYAIGLEQKEVVEKWETLTGGKFWSIYGQTETSGLVTFAEFTQKPGSAGRPCPLANLQIVNEHDTLLPAGQTGEIVLRGPLVFQGYWNADDLNSVTFREGFHHTGDLGSIDTDGYLFFKGRKEEKALIKSGGENVFPVEVEKVIASHDAVKEVCVFGVPDARFGEGIKAVCALKEGMKLEGKEIIDFTAARIASYKKPRHVEFIAALPRTEDGKIDRAKIKEEHG